MPSRTFGRHGGRCTFSGGVGRCPDGPCTKPHRGLGIEHIKGARWCFASESRHRHCQESVTIRSIVLERHTADSARWPDEYKLHDTPDRKLNVH